MLRQYELVERVSAYDPEADEALLNRAYVFAVKAHGTQTRASGDPYFSHPVEVAGILTDLKLDARTIATALLHDTVEDTDVTTEDIAEQFGPDIADLVDGVTKLTRLELTSERTKQAENFRKLLVAMARDVRVLLVKLADRLHNMRTLHFVQKPEKRRRIAQETMDIYAPLAGVIGMQDMRDELEDMAFEQINPLARESVLKRLDYLEARSGDVIARVATLLEDELERHGIEARVWGRAKKPYSIWRKMERKQISFEQLADIFAFRVITATPEDCYRALGAFHIKWPFVPGRFKDFISTPKRNDYRSIHTTVIGPEKQRVEIQIRTAAMDAVAERGVAAHWQYKYGAKRGGGEDSRAFRALGELVEMIEHGSGPEELLENTKLELFFDQVFCFTPKGDLIALPRGATPVDFAYAVHTDVGDTCVGARINGHHRPLRTRLDNGDMVEIIRSEAQTPRSEWESFVVTGKARAAIRRFVRQARRDQFVSLGRRMTQRVFEVHTKEFSDKAVSTALKRLKRDAPEDVYLAVGEGELLPEVVLEAVYPGIELEETPEGRRARLRKKAPEKRDSETPAALPIKGLIPGLAVHLGKCCHPLPGDRIVGIMSAGEGVMVHTIDCETLEQYQDAPERWLDLAWQAASDDGHVPVGRLDVLLQHAPGALGALSSIVAGNGGNISNLKITTRNPLYFEILLDIEVEDVKHLTQIMAALRASALVEAVERARG